MFQSLSSQSLWHTLFDITQLQMSQHACLRRVIRIRANHMLGFKWHWSSSSLTPKCKCNSHLKNSKNIPVLLKERTIIKHKFFSVQHDKNQMWCFSIYVSRVCTEIHDWKVLLEQVIVTQKFGFVGTEIRQEGCYPSVLYSKPAPEVAGANWRTKI